ncbi:MAG: anti-sigma factor, partial [Actinomycetota bacterium]|nr:anti-sigma factor [Actinomycetota bacterium]
ELSLLLRTTPPERLREQVLRDISSVRPLPPSISREAGDRIEATSRTATAPASSAGGSPSRRELRIEERRRWTSRWVAAAAAIAIIGGGAAVLHPWDRQSQSQLTVADRVLQAPDAQRVETTVATGGTATVVRSKSVGRAVLITSQLASAPSGKVYQLWLQDPGGGFVSAGLLPSGSNQTVVLDGDAAAAKGVGISVEPPGGSARPTTTPVALVAFA